MTSALIAGLNSIPPGYRMIVVVTSVVLSVGGGGFGIFTRIDTEFAKLNDRIDRYERDMVLQKWQMDGFKNNLDGHRAKNLEQDARLRDLEIGFARLGRQSFDDRRNP